MANNANTSSGLSGAIAISNRIRAVVVVLSLAMVAIWIVARALQISTGYSLLEFDQIIVLGIAAMALIGTALLLEVTSTGIALGTAERKNDLVVWTLLALALIVHAIMSFGTYRLIALSVSTALLGLQSTANAALQVLLTEHSWIPILPAALLAYSVKFGSVDSKVNYNELIGVFFCLVMALTAYSFWRARTISHHNAIGQFRKIPPTATKLATFVLVMLPIGGDMFNEISLAQSRHELLVGIISSSHGTPYLVSALTLHVRPEPNAKAESSGLIGFLESVRVVSTKDGWSEIGKEQWVSSSYLISPGDAVIAKTAVTGSTQAAGSDATIGIELEMLFSGMNQAVRGRYRTETGKWIYTKGTRSNSGVRFKTPIDGSKDFVVIKVACDMFGSATGEALRNCLAVGSASLNEGVTTSSIHIEPHDIF